VKEAWLKNMKNCILRSFFPFLLVVLDLLLPLFLGDCSYLFLLFFVGNLSITNYPKEKDIADMRSFNSIRFTSSLIPAKSLKLKSVGSSLSR